MCALKILYYNLRDANRKLLLPKPRSNYFKRSFSYSVALLWNNLPEEVHTGDTANSLDVFKRSMYSWFADQYSHTADM